jgi:hypothetical protein
MCMRNVYYKSGFLGLDRVPSAATRHRARWVSLEKNKAHLRGLADSRQPEEDRIRLLAGLIGRFRVTGVCVLSAVRDKRVRLLGDCAMVESFGFECGQDTTRY